LNKTYDETEELRKVWDQLSKSISEKKDEKKCHDQEHHRVLKSVHDYDITLRYADQYIEQITRDIDLRQTATYRMEDAITRMELDKDTLQNNMPN
jgi:hypothetical protein